MATSSHNQSAPLGVVYAFGAYELDTRLRELRCGAQPRHVQPQVFDLLAHLLAHRDRLVTKAELLDAVWGHRFVSPTTLNSRIRSARQAIGDDGTAQRVIRTVHGHGFRIVADVEERVGHASPGPAPTASMSTAPAGVRQCIRFCAAADGVRIAYATSGSGPPLVKPANWLTHLEFDWDSPVWRHWLLELSGAHTLIRYDERGSGLSDWNVEDLSFDAWVRDLESVVDELGLERFPLFALSQGCAVAIAYAARHPERVSRLVFCGGFAQGRFRRARTPAELEESQMLVRTVPLGWARDNPAFRQFFASIFLPEGTSEQHHWFRDLQGITTSPANAIRLLTTSAEIDVTKIAPRVSAPTLVLHAVGDAAVPFDQGRQLAALLPDAHFVPLESRNHILLADEPAWPRLVTEVRSFLSES